MANTAHDLFEHHLREIYDAEQKMVRALRRMAGNASDAQLAKGFTTHARTTERQVRRLEQIFKSLGRKPRRLSCAGMDGLIEEYTSFVRDQKPEEAVLDAFSAEAGLKAEHYEMVAYKGMVDLARQLGMKKEADLLKETLEEEKATAAELERMSKTLGKAMSMNGAGHASARAFWTSALTGRRA